MLIRTPAGALSLPAVRPETQRASHYRRSRPKTATVCDLSQNAQILQEFGNPGHLSTWVPLISTSSLAATRRTEQLPHVDAPAPHLLILQQTDS